MLIILLIVKKLTLYSTANSSRLTFLSKRLIKDGHDVYVVTYREGSAPYYENDKGDLEYRMFDKRLFIEKDKNDEYYYDDEFRTL